MSVHSGKYGQVNGVNTMRQWTIQEQSSQPKAVASNTAQGTARKRGVRSWSGTYQAYGVTPVVMPGDSFSFIGYGAPTNDVSGNGQRYEGTAVCGQVTLAWNWKAGALIGHNVSFDGDLELQKTSGADPGDAVAPQLLETTGTKIQWAYNDSGSYQELPNLVSATWRLTLPIESYVNSSTYVGTPLQAWTGRKPGAGLDWNLSIQQEDDERIDTTKIWAVDDIIKLRLFVDATHYWQLTYGIAGEFSGITVNRETGAIIARTLAVNMTGYYYGGAGLGQILMPGGVQWWP